MMLTSSLPILLTGLLGAGPCRIDQADRAITCEERRWAARGLQSPCALTASQLEVAFGLPPAAAASVFTALSTCGLKSERAWIAAATAAPGHVLPAWGVVSFLDYEQQGPALKKVLVLAPDPAALAFKLHTFGRLESEAERFLKSQGPRALADLAKKGVLSLDDAEAAYAAALQAELPGDSLGPLLALVLVKRLFSPDERPDLVRSLEAQSPVARAALVKTLAKPPWEDSELRHSPALDEGLEVIRALAGEAPREGGWLLYVALWHRQAEAFPLVADKVPLPYARRLAARLKVHLEQFSVRKGGDEAWRKRELAALTELSAQFTARGITAAPPSPPPTEGPDPAKETISSALDKPAPLPWKETRGSKRAGATLRAVPLPSGHRAVTPLTSSAVVATSQRVDPTGEASAGGYWLFTREKEGPWNAPLYTGLRVQRPYEVQSVSLDGATIRLVVRRRQIAEQTVSFPPIGLKTTGVGPLTTLECTVDELALDQDGDGLTDVLEGRLFTNPTQADTDGDGLRDDVDALPQVPASESRASLRAQVMGVALGFIDRDSPQPVMVTPDATTLSLAPPIPQVSASAHNTFLLGRRSDFVGVTASSRLLVLTEAEYAIAVERLGAFYPRRFELEFSEDGTGVWVTWSDRWRGGELLGRLVDGRWVMRTISAWVT